MIDEDIVYDDEGYIDDIYQVHACEGHAGGYSGEYDPPPVGCDTIRANDEEYE